MLRFLANILILSSLLFFPWWVTLVFALVVVFLVRDFYEIIAWAFVGDLLYGAKTALFFNMSFVFTICAAALFFTAERIKKMTRFY